MFLPTQENIPWLHFPFFQTSQWCVCPSNVLPLSRCILASMQLLHWNVKLSFLFPNYLKIFASFDSVWVRVTRTPFFWKGKMKGDLRGESRSLLNGRGSKEQLDKEVVLPKGVCWVVLSSLNLLPRVCKLKLLCASTPAIIKGSVFRLFCGFALSNLWA